MNFLLFFHNEKSHHKCFPLLPTFQSTVVVKTGLHLSNYSEHLLHLLFTWLVYFRDMDSYTRPCSIVLAANDTIVLAANETIVLAANGYPFLL